MSKHTATLVVLISLLAAPAMAEEACDAWALNGYRLGMSLDDASAVRPAKGKDSSLSVKAKGQFRGRVDFGEDGRLVQWAAIMKNADHAKLKGEMNELYGLATVNEEHEGSMHIGPKFQTSWKTDWISVECKTVIRLRRESIKVYSGDVLQVDTERVYVALLTPEGSANMDWRTVK
jgi:hypothetical protein